MAKRFGEKLNMINVALLVIGGSAGSLDVLLKVLPKVSSDLSFPIILVLHRHSSPYSQLTELLAGNSQLEVREAEEKEALLPGKIYIVPADYHLLIEDDSTMSLDYSEKVNFSRPSIDVTFQSAAEVFSNKLVCMLLSGSSADGVAGLRAVKKNGGMAIIQDPKTADFSYMPEQAAKNVDVDRQLTIEEMSDFINNLSQSND